MSRNIKILQGGMLNLAVYQNDVAATDVDFIMKEDDTAETITINAVYDAGVAIIEISAADTTDIGTYSYQINENTPDGPIKYGALDCDDCEFGKVIICESLDGAAS